jgi:hypothetical protein
LASYIAASAACSRPRDRASVGQRDAEGRAQQVPRAGLDAGDAGPDAIDDGGRLVHAGALEDERELVAAERKAQSERRMVARSTAPIASSAMSPSKWP